MERSIRSAILLLIISCFAIESLAQAPPQSVSDQEKDLEKLEKHYWQVKDTQFHVVQNRKFTKEKRYFITGLLGPLVNDQFSDATALNISGGYYPTERWGVALNYLNLDPNSNTMTNEFVSRFGVVPNHNRLRRYIGVSGNWAPVYAKASLHNSLIMYFDLSVGLGAGFIQYDQQFTDKENERKSTPAIALDLSQQVFLNNKVALKVSYIARWYKEVVRDSRAPFDIRSQSFNQTNLIMMGLTYFH